MKRLVDTKEAAEIKGVTPRTIRRWFEAGKIEGQLIDTGKGYGKAGQILKVWIEEDKTHRAEGMGHGEDNNKTHSAESIEHGEDNDKTHRAEGIGHSEDNDKTHRAEGIEHSAESMEHSEKNKEKILRCAQDDKIDRYRVKRGEIGQNVITPLENGIPIIETHSAESIEHSENKKDWILAFAGITNKEVPNGECRDPQEKSSLSIGSQSGPTAIASLSKDMAQSSPYNIDKQTALSLDRNLGRPSQEPPWGDKAVFELQSPANDAVGADVQSSEKSKHTAYLRLAILKAWRDKISENSKPKTQISNEFLQLYNSGLFLPSIYNDTGNISKSTLHAWDRAEKFQGIQGLIPQYASAGASKITEQEKYILLNCLLHQHRLKIGSAIKFTKTFLNYKKMPSPSSEATLRRFAENFKKTKYDVWVEAREGAKALNDKCLPYVERDWRLLTVGEGLVADGHRLNFRVINPFTGKPCRATIVLFWDWKSNYPLGWEIMLEENIQCIASALRNAILALGKIPKWLLIDNGKAFKAKCFTSEIDLEDGITYGMFATLGIHTHFSHPYNPQEKPLERFWGTFNNWFERLLPSYTGASIKDKPAYMMRNEKDAQARHNKWIPKIEEVQEMLLKWRQFYGDQPSRGRDGLKPSDIFEAEKGPGVDPGELHHLMMAKDTAPVHRNGVTFNGWHYYDEALYGIKDNVIIKYSFSDFSQIYCFYKNEFLCIAKPIEPVHPMASESEFPKDREAVQRISALKNKLKRGTKNLLGMIETHKEIDWQHEMRRSPEASQIVQAIESKEPKIVNISPFLDDENSSESGVRSSESENPKPQVNPKTGRTAPILPEDYEIYNWYRAHDPALFNEKDIEWIKEYRETESWNFIYKQSEERKRMAKTA